MKVFCILGLLIIIQFAWALPSNIEDYEYAVFASLPGCGVSWDQDSQDCATEYVSGLNDKRMFEVGWDEVLNNLVDCGFTTDNLNQTLVCLQPKKVFRKIEQDMNVEDIEQDIEDDEYAVLAALPGCGVSADEDSLDCANKYVSGLNDKRMFDVGWDEVLDELVKCGFKTDDIKFTLKCLEPNKVFSKIEHDMNV